MVKKVIFLAFLFCHKLSSHVDANANRYNHVTCHFLVLSFATLCLINNYWRTKLCECVVEYSTYIILIYHKKYMTDEYKYKRTVL